MFARETRMTITHLDTEAMPWEPEPDIPGFLAKNFHVDPDTGGFIQVHFVPPDWGADIFDGQPHRHYHATVYERALCLSGDFPHWEFADAADDAGTLKTFHRGVFMDRPPLTLHGLFPEPRSQVGSVLLAWNTGGGTFVGHPRAKQETIDVPFGQPGPGNVAFTSPRIFPVDDLPWRDHPVRPGWRAKQLTREQGPALATTLVAVPPGWTADADASFASDTTHRWLFVVHGDVALRADGQPVALRAEHYLDWQDGGAVGFAKGDVVSEGGATVLCVGHALD
jgi:hypothetical protein